MSELTFSGEDHPDPYEVIASAEPLLGHFGIEFSPVDEPERFITAVRQIDPRYKDGHNVARSQLNKDSRIWPADTKSLITEVAQRMRMTAGETPLIGHYDAVIALGGANQAVLDRARYAVQARNSRTATFKYLVMAGSKRPLGEEEQARTANYASGAVTEFDLCVGAAKTISQENPGSIASLALVDKEKSNTPEVLETVLEEMARNGIVFSERSTVAAITTQIYQQSTALDLARVAKRFGITETYTSVAGNPSAQEAIDQRTPATYLSEIVRTLRAATLAIQEEVA